MLEIRHSGADGGQTTGIARLFCLERYSSQGLVADVGRRTLDSVHLANGAGSVAGRRDNS